MYIEKNDCHLPLHVICYNVLSNDTMQPGCLECHLTTIHHSLKDKPWEFFDRKRNSLKQIKLDSTECFQVENEKAIEVSY